MMKLLNLVAICILLMSAKCSRTAGEYFDRPNFNECITLIQNGDTLGKMACNGEVYPIPDAMTIPISQDEYEEIRQYFIDRENGHYKCVRFPRRCK